MKILKTYSYKSWDVLLDSNNNFSLLRYKFTLEHHDYVNYDKITVAYHLRNLLT